MPFTIDDLKADGFVGFVALESFAKPQVTGGGDDIEGVYVVVRQATDTPDFLEDTHRKPRATVYSAAQAQAKWVDSAQLLYIGKGPLRKPRRGRRNGLAHRIAELRAHGFTGGANHYGGKLLWQTTVATELLVGWKKVPEGDAGLVEGQMIHAFVSECMRLPFANISSGSLRV